MFRKTKILVLHICLVRLLLQKRNTSAFSSDLVCRILSSRNCLILSTRGINRWRKTPTINQSWNGTCFFFHLAWIIRHCNTVKVLNLVFYWLVMVNQVKPIHFICHKFHVMGENKSATFISVIDLYTRSGAQTRSLWHHKLYYRVWWYSHATTAWLRKWSKKINPIQNFKQCVLVGLSVLVYGCKKVFLYI